MNNTNRNNSLGDAALSFRVLIDGNDLAEAADIVSIAVRKRFCKISSAEVVLHYGSLLNNEFVDDKNNDITIGNDLEIYAGETALCVFKGVVVKKSVNLSNKKSHLRLTAKNKAYKMTCNRYNSVFSEKTDSEIIEELIKKYGIDYDVDTTSYKNETVTQYNCTDWDFINLKAERNSLLVFADDDKIIVKKPKTGDTKIVIDGYESIIDFDAQLDGRNAFSDYKASSWNYGSQEKQEVEQSNSSDNFTQGAPQTKQLADKLGNNTFNININSSFVDNDLIIEKIASIIMRNNLSRIIGRVKLYGVSDVAPGETVKLKGVGNSFNGDAYATEVEFDFENGGWTTTIGFGMEETPYYRLYDDIEAAPTAEFTAATHGLQIAKVVALEGDPADDYRIKVALPCFDGENTEIWARLAIPDAGNKRGYFFPPELDDEVVVGFVDRNPNNPIILGSLHSNKIPTSQPLTDDNNKKGIYLKSGIKIEFDEENKKIGIETPDDNKLIMSNKDKKIEICDTNGNKIVMDSNGITIKSAGKITVDATSDISLKGINMTSEASASYKASGKANTEISSSGITAVKGSLVQIN